MTTLCKIKTHGGAVGFGGGRRGARDRAPRLHCAAAAAREEADRGADADDGQARGFGDGGNAGHATGLAAATAKAAGGREDAVLVPDVGVDDGGVVVDVDLPVVVEVAVGPSGEVGGDA